MGCAWLGRLVLWVGLGLIVAVAGCGSGGQSGPAARPTASPTPPAGAEAGTTPTTTAPARGVAGSPTGGAAASSPSSPIEAAGPTASPAALAGRSPANPELILATTTSTQDSGLLDVLVPLFEQATGYRVKTIAVGTGQALALGARGEADVVLVHAPDAELAWLAEGNGTERLLVMHNDFVVVGPPGDPAGVRGRPLAQALRAIATAGAPFVSRADNSGTDQLEKKLWRDLGLDPRGAPWYIEAGVGMGQTLTIASERDAYTLTDRATYLARRGTLQLDLLIEGDPELLNVYHVMPVNPAKFSRVNAEGGAAFARFMVSPEAQAVIAEFGVDRFGQPLFFPDAGQPEPSGR